MTLSSREMQVAALKDGTAIDHIPSEAVFEVVSLLHLQNLDQPITIGKNLESNKLGSKGIIKITDKFFTEEEINKIAIIAPKAVLNIIRDYKVVEKIQLTLPAVLTGIVQCNNPKCITNNEPMPTRFAVHSHSPIELKCHYCELKIGQKEIKLK